MAEPALKIVDLRKSFGGLTVTNAVTLDVRDHQIHALIGPNGAGKTTLISQISGELTPSAGRIELFGHDITRHSVSQRVRQRLARTFQISSVLPEFSVRDNVRIAALARHSARPSMFKFYNKCPEANASTELALARVGLAERAEAIADDLSYGERRHLEIAMALALEPRVLLLDEPMAGVGLNETQALAELLKSLKKDCAMVLVEHDMDVVFDLADQITVLVAGRVIASGSADEIRNNPLVQTSYFGEGDA